MRSPPPPNPAIATHHPHQSCVFFPQLTRGAVVKMFGKKTTKEMEEIEAAGDEQHSQVQRLVLEAVRLFRARGYNGTVNFSHTIAHFTESASVKVDGPAIGEPAPWELADAAATPTSRKDAKAKAMTEAVAAAKQVAEDGRSGMVFTTLLMRLERRAKSWQSLSGAEGLDPSLSSSAHIGFAMPGECALQHAPFLRHLARVHADPTPANTASLP